MLLNPRSPDTMFAFGVGTGVTSWWLAQDRKFQRLKISAWWL